MPKRYRGNDAVNDQPACSRRQLLGASLLLGAGLTLAASPARAVLEVQITRGRVQPVPVAVPDFAGANADEQQLGRAVAGIIRANLARSGLFRIIDPAAYIEKGVAFDRPPNFGSWRVIKAQALVAGRVSVLGNGQVQAAFRLWDIFAQQQILGLQFITTRQEWRRLGHKVSDAVYKAVTGDEGYFDTRIVFIDESGPKQKRVKRLAIMDQDSANLRYLTNGKSLVLTPRFSPAAQRITYLSYATGVPRIYILDLATGRRQMLGEFPNMSFAPRFSPDGGRLIFSLLEGGATNLFVMDLASRQVTRLTQGQAISTAPSFSPDGRFIVFESDREGTQQLYVMPASGGPAKRISFGRGRYSTPVWSPRGDTIAFTRMRKGRFAIGVMRPDGSGERILTEGYHNEGPTWAPNGRVLMFFRSQRGPNGGPRLYTVDLTGYNEQRVPTPNFASDPAWSPLLK